MREIEWSVPALDDLKTAGDYITEDNASAAVRMASRVREAVEHLRDHPNLGRTGRLSDTKELVVSGTPFIVVYRVRKGIVQVLRLLHHSQRWP